MSPPPPLPPPLVDLCSGGGWDITFPTAHFPRTESPVRRAPAGHTILMTVGELEELFVLIPEVAPPSHVAADEISRRDY